MKLVTITHSAEGIRINRGGVVSQFSNVIYLAEAYARSECRLDAAVEEHEIFKRRISVLREIMEGANSDMLDPQLKAALTNALQEEF